MVEILIAIGILGGLGLLFGVILAAASKIFYVKTDARLSQLMDALPGANCGGCGYAGCAAYAEAVLQGTAPIGACASGGNECVQQMSAVMGIEAVEMTRKVALVRCSGYRRTDENGKRVGVRIKGIYEGLQDCLAASKVAGNGPTVCKFGCLGFGSCVRVCQHDALSIVDGIAKVDEEKCIGCMACAQVCPRNLITAVDYGSHTIIACASHAKGSVTVRGCTQGCVGCGVCTRTCPEKAIRVDQNLAVIDYSKCIGCGLCATVCPKHLILSSVEDPSKSEAAQQV